ncbi:MAG: hypothetical protein M3Z17_00615 [Gemmatimonadota bacterium]|nr:hypothetical protein [Gemmatimonadota bacterium]
MKRLAILVALVACTNPSLSRTAPVGPGIEIPGAHLDDVRDAVVSQMTSKGFSVLTADENRIVGEQPIRSDWSGNFYSHREYFIWEQKEGVTIIASAGFLDKTPAALRRYSQQREVAMLGAQRDLSADLAAIKAQFTH